MTVAFLLFVLLFVLFTNQIDSKQDKKNVIIIMADDLGFNDVSYRGSNEIPTYNIDALAYNSIILNNFHTPALCTPSRSSLMTGKYPHHLGMQHFVIPSDEPWGLSLDEKIMPQYFKDAGYTTRLVGKWHLGFFDKKYTPNMRGFDSFFGYLGPYIDYFDYTLQMFDKNYSRGYDMRRNFDVVRDIAPKYATELFTDEAINVIKHHDKKNPLFLMVNHLAPHAGNEDIPMQAKAEDIEKFNYIADEKRRILAAMIYQLDKSVGQIVNALKESDMFKDSIIVFYSDNGGPTFGLHSTQASNFPFRGQKQSGFEGGIRTNSIIYAPSDILPQSVVRNSLFYVSDLLPTLNSLSGANFKLSKIDGIDQTIMLRYNLQQREELITIDDVFGYSSYIYYGYKIINGSSSNGKFDGHLGSNNNTNHNAKNYIQNVMNSTIARALKSKLNNYEIENLRTLSKIQCTQNPYKVSCDLLKSPCLFDLNNDPCEENNLAESRPYLYRIIYEKYQSSIRDVVKSRRKFSDPKCDPINFNFTWNWWR